MAEEGRGYPGIVQTETAAARPLDRTLLEELSSRYLELQSEKDDPLIAYERYWGKSGDTSINVYLRNQDSVKDPDIVEVTEGDDYTDVGVVARIWLTEKDEGGGKKREKGKATCYTLGDNGKWYTQDGDSYTYNPEDDTSYWDLSSREEVSEKQVRGAFVRKLEGIEAPTPQT